MAEALQARLDARICDASELSSIAEDLDRIAADLPCDQWERLQERLDSRSLEWAAAAADPERHIRGVFIPGDAVCADCCCV